MMARISTNHGDDLRALSSHDDTDILGRAWVLVEHLLNGITDIQERVLDLELSDENRRYLFTGIDAVMNVRDQLSGLLEDDRVF